MDLITDRNRAPASRATHQRHRACQTSVIPVVNHHCSNLNYNLWYSIASLHRWKRDGNFRAIFSNNFSNRFLVSEAFTWEEDTCIQKKKNYYFQSCFFLRETTNSMLQTKRTKKQYSPVWRSYILFLLICETKQKS